jgi:hypothetical protein
MARTPASACAAASLAFFFAVVAEVDAVTDGRNVVIDDDLARGRDLIPLPPVPETMAVPTPTEAAEHPPAPPPVAPRVHTPHRKHASPKPAEGVEEL